MGWHCKSFEARSASETITIFGDMDLLAETEKDARRACKAMTIYMHSTAFLANAEDRYHVTLSKNENHQIVNFK